MAPDGRRVLVMAEAANPEWVSSPLVAWSHYEALARVADVHLVTQVRNRDAIRRAGVPEDGFTAIDSERVAAPLNKLATFLSGGQGKGWSTLAAFRMPSYYYFEHLVWKTLGARLGRGEFDLVHRIAPITPACPSPIAPRLARVGVPFVVGPLNGGLPWPREFESVRRREGEWLSYLRTGYKLLPGHDATRRHATALLVASRATWNDLDRRWRRKAIYLPENAIDPARFDTVVDRPAERPLRAAFVGRLVPCKGVDMLLEAAAPLVSSGDLRLDVMGDGPEMGPLKGLVDSLGIGGGVALDGWVEHERLAERLVESDVFAFPSIHDFGGGVVLEAMALGLPPIVVDYGGPAELLTDDTGRTVPLGNREEVVRGLRTALEWFAADPARARDMGRRARERVFTLYTWDAKARQMLEVYDWASGRRTEKPDFGFPLARVPDAVEMRLSW